MTSFTLTSLFASSSVQMCRMLCLSYMYLAARYQYQKPSALMSISKHSACAQKNDQIYDLDGAALWSWDMVNHKISGT